MDELTKAAVLALLRDALTLSVDVDYYGPNPRVMVRLKLEGETFTEDMFYLPS